MAKPSDKAVVNPPEKSVGESSSQPTQANGEHQKQKDSLQQNGNNKEEEENVAEEANIVDLIPQPPDGGWGWMIVVASFMNHFIIDGIGYAFGTMLSTYSTYFGSSAATTGALMSTLIGCYLLSGENCFI